MGRRRTIVPGMTRGFESRLLKALAGLAIVFGPTTSPAIGQAAVQACVVMADDAERLACYDALFRDAAVPVAGAITVLSARPIPARPSGREPASLTLVCDAGQMVVSFRFAGQLVSNTGDIAPLTYQVDANATIVRTLRASADNTELTFASAADTESFLDNLLGGTSVRVRMTPVRQRSLTVDFRLPEVADDIAALRASCG